MNNHPKPIGKFFYGYLNALNARSDQQSLFKLGLSSNRLLLGGIGVAILLQVLVIYAPPFQKIFHTVPLDICDWGIIVLIGAAIFVVEELRKLVAPKLFNRDK